MAIITVVGAGLMGSALINAFLNTGNRIKLVSTNPKTVEKFVGRDVEYAPTLDLALDSDFIVLCLPNHAIVEKVIKSCEPDALAGKKIVNTTTATPNEIKSICSYVIEKGGKYLDAKIECYPPEVGTSSGSMLYSGDEELFNEIQTILTSLSNNPLFVDRNPAAAAIVDVGVVVDFHCSIYLSMLESIALANKHEISVDKLLEVTQIIRPDFPKYMKRQLVNAFSNGIPEEYEDAKEATLNNEYNGLKTVVASMKEQGINPTFSGSMLKMMESAVNKGLGKKDIVAVMSEIIQK